MYHLTLGSKAIKKKNNKDSAVGHMTTDCSEMVSNSFQFDMLGLRYESVNCGSEILKAKQMKSEWLLARVPYVYAPVDMLGLRCKSTSFEAKKSPDSRSW